jgi:hypothetical protein
MPLAKTGPLSFVAAAGEVAEDHHRSLAGAAAAFAFVTGAALEEARPGPVRVARYGGMAAPAAAPVALAATSLPSLASR